MEDIFILSFITILISLILWGAWPIIIGAVFVPTPMNIVRKMLEIAEMGENDILIDLGSGDGRIIIEAAKTYEANAIGIEADPLRVLWSRFNIRAKGLQSKVKIVWGNFFKTDISNATVITVYQGQGINNKLISKFEEELEPGTRIVSYSFTFDGWVPCKEDQDSGVYLYKVPKK